MKRIFLTLTLAWATLLGGCGPKKPAAGLPEIIGSGIDTGHYVQIGGLKWKKYNIGATALPSEDWERSVGSYFSYANRAAFVQKHCVNGWRIPTREDYSKILPSEIFVSTAWERTDRKTSFFRDSNSGIKYEMCNAGRRQHFARIIQGSDTLEFPAAGFQSRDRSIGMNGVYMTTTPLDGQLIRVYYLDPSILTIHKWGRNMNISVRLVKDLMPSDL